MTLRDRIDRIEELVDRSRSGDHKGLRIIRIVGGLPEPANATIDGARLEIAPGELIEAFERRAVEAAREAGEDYIILTGCDG
jgi:hypothetical protein